mgnify:CR=1 FL=1
MKRSKSRLNSSSENRLFKNKQYLDIERCQDELFKMKIRYNKLNQEYLELKVEYNKLEREYKYNVKLMEAIIKEANISVVSEFLGDENNNENNIDNNNNNNNNEIKQTNLSKSTIKILKEKSIYERLKIEIMNLKDELRQKENIINELKSNIKTSKFKEMDTKYAQIYQELSETKNRNEFLESMQKDYINSKNQIIFILQQIDLYKKDNKRQKEKIEKLVLTTQNTIMQKEENDNQKTLEEHKVKMLKNDNDKLQKRIKEIESKNFAYYEEMEKLKNQKQNQTDKYINKKDNEIRRYKAQIIELKMEISKLQKQLDEKNNMNNNIIINKKNINKNPNNNNIASNRNVINKNTINTNTNTNSTGGEKSLRKTESDFFLTSQKIVLNDNKKSSNNNEKIIINSKDTIDENKIEKKQKSVKTNNKSLNSINNNYIKVNDKNNNNNNFDRVDPNAIVIKGGQHFDNFSEEKNTEINEDQKTDENKEEDEKEKSKSKDELSKVEETEKENLKEDDKKNQEEKYEVNDDNILIDIKTVDDGKDNDKMKEEEQNDKEKEKEKDENKADEEKISEGKSYKEEKRSQINKEKESSRTSELFKEMNNENNGSKNEKGENKVNQNDSLPPTSYDKKKKFNEDEIINDFSKDENINKQKYHESMDEYNDFENNFSKSNEFDKNSNIKNEKDESRNKEEANKKNNNNDNDDYLI